MLLYIMFIIFILILILIFLAFTNQQTKKINPIDRVLKDHIVEEYVADEKDQTKHVRWSNKLSNLVFKNKGKQAKTDPYRSFLAQADIEMTSEEFLLIRLLFTAAFGFLGYSIWKSLIMMSASALVVWFIPRIMINIRIKNKQKKFDEQLMDAISVLSNSLKAGYSFFQALSSVVEEMPNPLSKEFKIMLKEMSFGLSLDQAFHNLLERVYTGDLHLLTVCVLIQRDIGGNLAELLDNIGETIRERQKLNGELKSLTAQGRLSGSVVSGLPVALGLIMYFINRDYIMLLFNTTLGNVMLFISIVFQLIGILAINKIVKVEL